MRALNSICIVSFPSEYLEAFMKQLGSVEIGFTLVRSTHEKYI